MKKLLHKSRECKNKRSPKRQQTKKPRNLCIKVEKNKTETIHHFEKLFSPHIQKLFKPFLYKPPVKVAVICPENPEALLPALQAAASGVIEPFFIGSLSKIRKAAKQLKASILENHIIDLNTKAAVEHSIQLAKVNKVSALMKGSLHTDELMAAVVNHDTGLYAGRRISHCMLVDVPSNHKPIIMTDGALNVSPKLSYKKDIVQNAINFAIRLGIKIPKVALLSALETPTKRMPSTLDCAELKKMADKGEIRGGIIEGPIAIDIALSKEAARIKGLKSKVAGDADIFFVPYIEVGNILIKSLQHLAHAKAYGIIVGATVPIILTSRSASFDERIGSCLLAKFYTHSK